MDTICNKSGIMLTFYTLKIILKILFILVPILIVFVSIATIINSMKKDNDYKQTVSICIKRVVAGVIIFLIPSLFTFIFNSLVDMNGDNIMACFNNSSIEKVKELKKKEEHEEEERIKREKEKQEEQVKQKKEEEEKQNESMNDYKENQKENSPTGGNYSNLKGNAWVNQLFVEAKKVTDYVRTNGFSYGNAPINPAINHDAKKVSCDRCVGWFLYNMGYTDQPEAGGVGLGDFPSWAEKHGFKRINNYADLKPGDAVFVNPGPDGNPTHMFLLANYIGDGIWERYDCGSDGRIQLTGQYSGYSSQPFREPVNNFLFAYRAKEAG